MTKNSAAVKWGKSIFVTVPFVLFMQTTPSLNAEQPNIVQMHQKSATSAVEDKQTSTEFGKEKMPLDKALIEKRTDQFMNQLVQEVDRNYKVEKYDSKQALLKDFKPFAKQQAAEKYVDYFYQEKQSGLYILPTETPPWFVNGEAYDTINIDETHKQVIQTNTNEIYGEYTIAITFEFDGKWLIKEIDHK
ncbi:hypothetical protein [Thalassobacillus devorans]|uniref:hypothetical protein n=1 Tax=Thalassobacillus devorans TaxID=279813 RepID=UPI0006862792|nr:hypothetical protein [Thalassobacillus devorans]